MCNFVVRPIKSYATVDIQSADGELSIKRGDVFQVNSVQSGSVNGHVNGDTEKEFSVPLTTFVHTFTANYEDIKKQKEEEAKWFAPAKAEAKKPAKE